MSQEHSAEWLRGAVAVLGRMVDDCSTVFDSDLPHITQSNLEDYLAEYGALLAAAEARESWKADDWFDWPPPVGVDEVIAYRPDAGVFPAQVGAVYEGDRDWFTHGFRKSLDGRLPTKWKLYPEAPGTSSHPTASEAGTEAALKSLLRESAAEFERSVAEGSLEDPAQEAHFRALAERIRQQLDGRGASPTASEVIAGAKKALLLAGASCTDECVKQFDECRTVHEALAALAAWEAAQR